MKNCPLSKNGCVHFQKLSSRDAVVGMCCAHEKIGINRLILYSDKQCPCPDLMQEPEKSLAERVVERHYGDYAESQYYEKKVELFIIINEELEKEKSV